MQRLNVGAQEEVYCVAASDSSALAITGSQVCAPALPAVQHPCTARCSAPLHCPLLSGARQDGTARVWDLRTCKTVRAFKAFSGETVRQPLRHRRPLMLMMGAGEQRSLRPWRRADYSVCGGQRGGATAYTASALTEWRCSCSCLTCGAQPTCY